LHEIGENDQGNYFQMNLLYLINNFFSSKLMKNLIAKFVSRKRLLANVIGILVLVVLYYQIYTHLDADSSRTLLIKVVFCLVAYAALWDIPHAFSFGVKDERHLPTIFFITGAVLVWVGCLLSVYLTNLSKNQGAWEHIAEILPLIFGAIVGGNYCCNAILGQEFNEEDCRIGYPGVCAGGIIVTAPLILFFSLYRNTSDAFISIFIIGVAPLLALLALNFVENRKALGDPPFYVFLIGTLMIVAAFVSTKWLLDEASKAAFDNSSYFNKERVITIIKNFVPSYYAAIGVGLIVRAMEKNIPAFSLEKWARQHLDLVSKITAQGNHIFLKRIDVATKKEQTLEIAISPSVLNRLKRGSGNRVKYGVKANAWLEQYLNQHPFKPNITSVLRLPKASELIKQKLHR
jgi:hypothetical protein